MAAVAAALTALAACSVASPTPTKTLEVPHTPGVLAITQPAATADRAAATTSSTTPPALLTAAAFEANPPTSAPTALPAATPTARPTRTGGVFGRLVVVQKERNGDLWLYSSPDKSVNLTRSLKGRISQPAWSPGGKYIVFAVEVSNNLDEYWAINADTLERRLICTRKLTFTRRLRISAETSFSEDGKLLVIPCQHLTLVDMDDFSLTDTGRIGDDFSLSPDGKNLMWQVTDYETYVRFNILSLQDNRLEYISTSLNPPHNGTWYGRFSLWGADSQSIFHVKHENDKGTLYHRKLDEPESTKIAGFDSGLFLNGISPDGRWIVAATFTTKWAGNFPSYSTRTVIYLIASDGSITHIIKNVSPFNHSWTPDGKNLILYDVERHEYFATSLDTGKRLGSGWMDWWALLPPHPRFIQPRPLE